jgi:ABC-type uncharacterized transport system permease subunit
MIQDHILGVAALAAQLPPALLVLRRQAGRDASFWLVLAVAVAGPFAWVMAQEGGTWRTGFSITLGVTVTVSMALFALVAALSRHGWRLSPLVALYMVCLCGLALAWQHAPEEQLRSLAHPAWMHTHIVVSVITYALVTLAGVAALAAILQERALKAKRPNRLTRLLPSVADSEVLLVRLLGLGEGVLALGLVTGMGLQYRESGSLLVFDHKTVLTVAAFAVIGGLLVAHYRFGVRGRLAARIVMVAYLLLTLGYPGVKFVTDVLMS